jgi:hypothetical protein
VQLAVASQHCSSVLEQRAQVFEGTGIRYHENYYRKEMHVLDKLKETVEVSMKPLKKVILMTLAFCVGAGVLVSSYNPAVDNSYLHSALMGGYHGPSIEPLLFALGLAICIVAGVVLSKEIREYLKE